MTKTTTENREIHYFINTDGKSNKYYIIERDGTVLKTSNGRLGTHIKAPIPKHNCMTHYSANHELQKLIYHRKYRKGYAEVSKKKLELETAKAKIVGTKNKVLYISFVRKFKRYDTDIPLLNEAPYDEKLDLYPGAEINVEECEDKDLMNPKYVPIIMIGIYYSNENSKEWYIAYDGKIWLVQNQVLKHTVVGQLKVTSKTRKISELIMNLIQS